jgi:hypothetical protein
LGKLLELRVSLDVVTDLQGCESDVERADKLVVLRRRSRWEIVSWTATKQQQDNYEGECFTHHKAGFFPQRRKDAKKALSGSVYLCAFAPLRETPHNVTQ